MPWIPLNKRDITSSELVSKLANQFDSSEAFEDHYNENDYGLLSSDELNTKLRSLFVDTKSVTSNRDIPQNSQSEDIESSTGASDFIAEGDSYDRKSLRYLRANAKRREDRDWAELLYSRALLDLWRQYVMDTGETYYPPLAEDLIKFYEFEEDNN